jgi:hypothetical protein
MSDIPIQLVEKLELQAGDLLHVRVGLTSEEMGGDQPPWIPGPNELRVVQEEWDAVVPEGVTVLVTHIGHAPTLIRQEDTDDD